MATFLQEWLEDLRRNLFRKGSGAASVGTRFAEVREGKARRGEGFFSVDTPVLDPEIGADSDETAGLLDLPLFADEAEQEGVGEGKRAGVAQDIEERGIWAALAVRTESRPATPEQHAREEVDEDWAAPKRQGPLRRNAPPEESELKRKRAKFSALQSQLTEKELLAAGLHNELASVKTRYLQSVGVRYADLDELQARIAELHARSRPLDGEAQREARRARRQAERSRAAVEQPSAATPSAPSPLLKRLFRQVAKRIHPDLAAGPADHAVRARLMAEANRAYRLGSEARLRSIVEDYECSPETVSGEDTAAELVRIIRRTTRVRRRLAEMDRGFEQIRQSELYRLKERVDQKAKQGADLLEEMAEKVGERIARAQKKLAEVMDELGRE